MAHPDSVLETLFPGVSREQFLQDYWLGDRHLVVHGDPERFTRLLDAPGLPDLDELLTRHRGNVTGSVRDRRGQQVHLHSSPAEEALMLYEAGATLHIDQFDDNVAGLGRAGKALAAELGMAPDLCRCTAFAATVPGPGSPLHQDNKDIFVIQLEGAKRWRVGPNHELSHPTTNVWPWAANGPAAHRDIKPALTTVELQPGTALFLPRGHWHETEVLTESCFAVTTGYQRATWLQLLQVGLVNHLGENVEWRAPAGSVWGTSAQRAAVRDGLATRLRRLADELASLDPDVLLGKLRPAPMPVQRFPEAALTITERRGADGPTWDVTIAWGGHENSFEVDEPEVIEVLRWVDGRQEPFLIEEAVARFKELDPDDVKLFLDKLLKLRLIVPPHRLAPTLDLFRLLLTQQ